MKYWTAYLRGQDEPVLVREGFAWGAFLFGPLWLAWHRTWIPAAISLAILVLIQVFVPAPVAGVLLLAAAAYFLLQGRILAKQGPDSDLARAVGADFKGKMSLVLYLAAIPLALYRPWIAGSIYALVALIWLIPDRRIERVLTEERSRIS